MDHQESTVDRLLSARAAIDEKLREHKTVLTVLFTDVVGSTEYFDRYGDTAGVAMLHRHAQLGSNTVEEFRGRVIKTIGDSVMAEFAEPALGVRAAVEIQRRLTRLNQTLPERERLELRIGLNHGPCYLHGKDIFGDAVNLAARITKKTGPAQILISHSVRDAVAIDPNLRCNWLGEITVKGKEEKENIYEVIWTDAATYSNLRQNLTGRFARGELISPGVKLEDLVQAVPAGTPSPAVEAVPIGLTPPPEAVRERYEILGEVGSGGMGIVYKACDRETNEVVALKVLRPEIAADGAAKERFKNELRLTRKITHKNVCRIHEFNRAGNTAFISMEFVEGESLRQRLNRSGKLSLEEGLHIAEQICAGLKEAHDQGIVHRDLKPENIMVDKAGIVKVMDFGIARLAGAQTTQIGTIVGTPAYMAPEQAEGKPVDQRTDIYALGLLLYEVFTGQPTFTAETPIALALKQLQEAAQPPSKVESEIPSHLDDVILRCLAKDPRERFKSVSELKASLRQEPGPKKEKIPLAQESTPQVSLSAPLPRSAIANDQIPKNKEVSANRGLVESELASPAQVATQGKSPITGDEGSCTSGRDDPLLMADHFAQSRSSAKSLREFNFTNDDRMFNEAMNWIVGILLALFFGLFVYFAVLLRE